MTSESELKIPDECKWIIVANGVAATTIFAFTGYLATDAVYLLGIISPAILILVFGVTLGLLASVTSSARRLLCVVGISAFTIGCSFGLATIFSNTCSERSIELTSLGGLKCVD